MVSFLQIHGKDSNKSSLKRIMSRDFFFLKEKKAFLFFSLTILLYLCTVFPRSRRI